MGKALKVVLLVSIALIILSGGFIGGFVVGGHGASDVVISSGEQSAFEKKYDEVRTLLDERALTPPSESSATAGALQGLLDSTGDKYAMYFDKRHYQYFSEENNGEFGGIGVVLGEKDGTAYIVEVYKDTPAEQAGIKANDVFVSIDGVSRDKWTTQEVVKRVRGKAGTSVKLTFLRPSKGKKPEREYSVKVTRAMIKYPNIESKMYGKVGYVRLGQFNATAAADLHAEFDKLSKRGASSYVLDLRDNPGGLLEQSIDVTSLFVKSGAVVRVEERNAAPATYSVSGKVLIDAPLVVLINGNSASASEIVSGALQDHKRATLVGEKSFGKGSVQTIEELGDGSAVKFTIAHYLTPKRRSIDGKGLTPDVVVKMDAEKQADPKKDTQLQRALAIARAAK